MITNWQPRRRRALRPLPFRTLDIGGLLPNPRPDGTGQGRRDNLHLGFKDLAAFGQLHFMLGCRLVDQKPALDLPPQLNEPDAGERRAEHGLHGLG